MIKSKLLISIVLLISHTSVYSFGVDVCFKKKKDDKSTIRNCINVKPDCRTDHLSHIKSITCRLAAVIDSIKGFSGENGIIGGRSLVHSDSTYFLAQLLGYSPWQAYQMMIYSEATDQAKYNAFNQQGQSILTKDETNYCRQHWGIHMPSHCLIITPFVKGIGKFSPSTGGSMLHLHPRYSPENKSLEAVPFPIDYVSSDPQLRNFRAWVFDQRPNMCVAGITQQINIIESPCAKSDHEFNNRVNLSIFGFYKMTWNFITRLGVLTLHNDDKGRVLATNQSFQSYITPQEMSFAKMGIFIHSLGDRYSHHQCTDRSYFYRESTGDYNSNYSRTYCAQGSHFLWHVWEQGTDQSDKNLDKTFQTMRPALEDVYDQLIAYADYKGISINQSVDKKTVIDELITVLQTYNAKVRLDRMVNLMEKNKLLPLPGHGSAANYSVDQWLKKAGAPM